MFADFKDKHVLLLQGPLGLFFKRLAEELEDAGAKVTKINFNGGDALFSARHNSISYTGTLDTWPAYAQDLLRERDIDCAFLLGDMRPYHRPFIKLAKEMGKIVYVFEEGYLRPDFITLEPGGVNGNSPMSTDPQFYLDANLKSRDTTEHVGHTFGYSALLAILYYIGVAVGSLKYRHYIHHRKVRLLHHGLYWVRGTFRKYRFRMRESGILPTLLTQKSKQFFLFPLQVHNDYQFKHSPYARIEDCIEEVIESFAQHADESYDLVIKHHPADRPYRDYTTLVRNLCKTHSIERRVYYVHDLHLPTLLKHARGTILVNSTVGLSSIHHHTPVKVLGKAIYNLPGLTHQGPLAEFWKDCGEVDETLYKRFRGWLEHNNQANGSFYRRLKGYTKGTGVQWHELPRS